MKLLFAPRHVIRLLTNLAAIAAVCVIFAAGATNAGVGADAATEEPARIATAPN